MDLTGTNYIDTGIKLFSEENINKDFEIDFDVIATKAGGSEGTLIYNIDDSQEVSPGFQITSNYEKYYIKGNSSNSNNNKRLSKSYSIGISHVTIKRKYNLLYWSINNGEDERVINFIDISSNFDNTLTIGAMIDSGGIVSNYALDVIANIEVKLDDQNFNFTESKTANSYRLDGAIKFDGTNYIDTGLKLFSAENIDKDFEINFKILQPGNQNVSNTTICNSKLEVSPYPGFALKFTSSTDGIFRTTYNGNKDQKFYRDILQTVKIERRDNKIYYTANNGTEVEMKDFTGFTSTFNIPVTFGCSLNSSGKPWRYFIGVLGNIKVEIKD